MNFKIDGRDIAALPGETILQAAERHGIAVPHLCYTEGMRPDGNCRACVVEIKGERVLAPSCARKPTEGMKVRAASDRAKAARQMVFELLIADQPDRKTAHDPQSKFWAWADRMNIGTSRFPAHGKPSPDRSPLEEGEADDQPDRPDQELGQQPQRAEEAEHSVCSRRGQPAGERAPRPPERTEKAACDPRVAPHTPRQHERDEELGQHQRDQDHAQDRGDYSHS